MTFFYDINKKLKEVLDTPKSVHQNLNEGAQPAVAEGSTGDYSAKKARTGKDIGKPGKNFEKIAKSAGEKYGSKERGEKVAGAVLAKLRGKNESVEEGLGDVVRKGVAVAKKVGSKALDTLGHGSDEDLRKDLQRKMGLPATGEKPRTPLAKEAAAPMTPKQKKFAKLAPPADKITFADKIAGAKKEVDEMLGDVAAEAMKGAVTRKIAGKRYGGAAQKDDEPQVKPAAPRGRGRPKKSTDTEQGAELKPDWSAFGVGKVKLPAHKGNVTKHKLSDKEPGEKVKESATPEDREVLERLMDQAFAEGKNALGNAIQGVLEMMSDGEEELDEKAVSKKQQKFMGMVHAAQKGEKPASKEVAKVAKSMGKKDAKDFAATKHKGLPEKAPKKDKEADKSADKPKKAKKEKTEEAGGSGTPTASSGFSFGKGIYDSMNREIEDMIAESMNVSMNMNNDAMGGPTKSLTVTATDDDAEKLGELLKMAGVGGEGAEACPSCGQASCGCDGQMDEAYGDTTPTENAPDYPTETETSDDALQYAGGINKPKATGQTTVPVIASQEERQHSYAEMEEDAIRRMMEMAGIKTEAKKVEEDDVEEGNKFTGNLAKARAAGKKEADLDGDGDLEKVRESMNNLWKAYKG
jgi:hypothetical protein